MFHMKGIFPQTDTPCKVSVNHSLYILQAPVMEPVPDSRFPATKADHLFLRRVVHYVTPAIHTTI